MLSNMRLIRLNRGLTTNTVSHAIGVNTNSLQRWERGDSEPVATNLIRLAKYYDCTVDYLLGLTDDPSKRASVEVKK